MILLLLGLLTAPALAEPGVAGGEDLLAWRGIDHRGDDRLEAYRAFLDAWPMSPLAEVAYARLVESGALSINTSAPTQYPQIEQSYQSHQRVLSQQVDDVIVAPLLANGEPVLQPDSGVHMLWTVGALIDERLQGTIGIGVQSRTVAFVSRISAGNGWAGSAAVRASSPGTGFFTEFAARTSPGVSLVAGPRVFMTKGAWAELGFGIVRDAQWTPMLRLELVQSH